MDAHADLADQLSSATVWVCWNCTSIGPWLRATIRIKFSLVSTQPFRDIECDTHLFRQPLFSIEIDFARLSMEWDRYHSAASPRVYMVPEYQNRGSTRIQQAANHYNQPTMATEWQRVVNAERRRPMHAGQQPAMQAAQQRAIGLERQLPESAEQQRPLLPSGQDTRSQHLQTEQRMDYEKHTSERKKADTGFWPHWKALIIITSSLVAGLSLALGHHFLYQSVQGRVVTDVSVSQAWMLRFGTAFAFLVNTAFAIGVAASYVQYQWLQLRSHNFKLEEIDSLTDVLKNALCFIYNFVFFKQPVLFLMATVAWYELH